MKKLNNIKRLKVGRRRYRVYNGGSPVDNYGMVKDRDITIWWSDDRVNNLDTFLHELMHAIWDSEGIPERAREERVISELARGMAAAFRDNKGLAACMERYISGKED